MPSRPVIVATVRDAADVLESFVRYHLAIGFAHIYLFFDDPADPCIATLRDHPQVSAIPCDASLRTRWPGLRSWNTYRDHIDTEVMARQILNCELAIGMAAVAGFDWILHIDSDELFYCESGSAPEHFAALDFRGTRNAVYLNFEALPEQLEIADYFRAVTLFKVNLHRQGGLRFDARQFVLMKHAHFTDPTFNFHLYGNGKSAARIGPGLVPATVHEFARHQPGGAIDRSHESIGDSHLILHYPNCGLARFTTKYRTLGNFADKWFGTSDTFPFHREARDIVAQGDDAQTRRFYEDRVMLHPAENLQPLLDNDILRRIEGPARLLARLLPGS